jgi:hypothetical protein
VRRDAVVVGLNPFHGTPLLTLHGLQEIEVALHQNAGDRREPGVAWPTELVIQHERGSVVSLFPGSGLQGGVLVGSQFCVNDPVPD